MSSKVCEEHRIGQRPHAGSLSGSSALYGQRQSFIKENAGHLPYASNSSVSRLPVLVWLWYFIQPSSEAPLPEAIYEKNRTKLPSGDTIVLGRITTNMLLPSPSPGAHSCTPACRQRHADTLLSLVFGKFNRTMHTGGSRVLLFFCFMTLDR